ncbi:MAG: hypothetical protein K6E33_08890 [Lachnospiraceae bacterium]|nr:hypothetical protein [Lachnospiraceae bacterium]
MTVEKRIISCLIAVSLTAGIAGCGIGGGSDNGNAPAVEDTGKQAAASETEKLTDSALSETMETVFETGTEQSLSTEPPAAVSDILGTGSGTDASSAYGRFLSGESELVTAESFKGLDEEYYMGLPYGTYDLSSLRDAVAELEMVHADTKYGYITVEGKELLVIRFESTDDSLMSWNGIINYNGEGLELNYSFEDGYRSYAKLYDSGYVEYGGSSGAGASGYTITKLDGNGFGSLVFSLNEYYSSFAESILYDLGKAGEAAAADGSYMGFTDGDDFFVREYVADGQVLISPEVYSSDAENKGKEEAFIAKLVELGAKQVTKDEMDAFCDEKQYVSPEVNLTLLEKASQSGPVG